MIANMHKVIKTYRGQQILSDRYFFRFKMSLRTVLLSSTSVCRRTHLVLVPEFTM